MDWTACGGAQDGREANIMRRLNVHAVADLVRYAVREHIIQA
jgi:hypothetical protein